MNANFKSDVCRIAASLISGMNVAYLKKTSGIATMNGQQTFEVDFDRLTTDAVAVAHIIHQKADEK